MKTNKKMYALLGFITCLTLIISIGDSVTDRNMSDNAGIKFYGALWDCEKEESYAELSKGDTIQSPLEIISLLN